MRILVCGGRDGRDRDLVFKELVRFDTTDTVIIEGDANGYDKLAGDVARKMGFWVWPCPADWHRHGNSAGPIRNRRMFRESRPDYAICFPGGSGTADMKEILRDAKVQMTWWEDGIRFCDPAMVDDVPGKEKA